MKLNSLISNLQLQNNTFAGTLSSPFEYLSGDGAAMVKANGLGTITVGKTSSFQIANGKAEANMGGMQFVGEGLELHLAGAAQEMAVKTGTVKIPSLNKDFKVTVAGGKINNTGFNFKSIQFLNNSLSLFPNTNVDDLIAGLANEQAQAKTELLKNIIEKLNINISGLSAYNKEGKKEAVTTEKLIDQTEDNGEIEINKSSKKGEKNIIKIHQTHYYNQAFAEAFISKRKGASIPADNNWIKIIEQRLAEWGLNNGSKKYQVTIEGTLWQVEFYFDVQIPQGTKEEFQSFKTSNPSANILVPFIKGTNGQLQNQSNGFTTFLDVDDLSKEGDSSVIHEFLHNLGLSHDNSEQPTNIFSIMSYEDNRRIIENDVKNIVRSAIELANKTDEKQVKITAEFLVNHQDPSTKKQVPDKAKYSLEIDGKKEEIKTEWKGNGKVWGEQRKK